MMRNFILFIVLLGIASKVAALRASRTFTSSRPSTRMMAHAQEGKRSMRRKLAKSKRPVRKTGASERCIRER